jgi:phosphohistidine phosphatase
MKHLKVLQVARHAKSAWDSDGVADIDRSLKSRGIRNAYEISRRLKLDGLIPQKIISSPADRALHTAVIFARVFEYPLEQLEINNILYAASLETILDLIRGIRENFNTIMIFGHNPEFTEIVNHFAKKTLDNIPTSGVVTLKFDCTEWSGIDRSNLERQLNTFPKAEE